MSKIRIVIPARFGSSRLPGKPLLDICGKPMIVRVIEQVLGRFEHIYVATDDQRIIDAVAEYDVIAVMTSDKHESGTDRLAEVAQIHEFADDDIVVNLQGDEPLIEPELLQQVARLLDSNSASMSTLMTPITSVADLLNPNVVKVVHGENNKALYFSRAPIPYPRDAFSKTKNVMPEGDYFRHLGLYAYKVSALKSIPTLPVSTLEGIEKLEQLRPLASGFDIVVENACMVPKAGVDTQEDLDKVIEVFAKL
ncbi:3-deoxy-manno-octulosonate cytidylyltransferase [Psychromonas ossibalaenae]|uniref:3-deoxy-manno-octulosonate cytidylyltransferase n=1 Tax=Psychromonas ossibalaenae TaxID=444922 RepID=UPI00037AAE63|nr:3-deoxy-manno-octulosonate cytidylyltransferase [Psychromonas ossibalaenae]